MSFKLFSTLLLLAGAVSCGRDYITYEEYGAKGDGRHDDMPAIVAAHDAANAKGLPVKARDGATYYIGSSLRTACIRTDTFWGTARFIIDDSGIVVECNNLDNVDSPVFRVESSQPSYEIEGMGGALLKGQPNLGVKLPCRSLVHIQNDTHRVYIRKGENQNNGVPQQEMLVADADGNIEESSAIIWDYERITSATAWPIDTAQLTISGGVFTTIANRAPSQYSYFVRGIDIRRSNVLVEGLTHYVKDELEDHGAPYYAFLWVRFAADVTLRNCLLTPHRIYWTTGSAGIPARMGSYDLGANSSVNVRWEDISQTIDIDNPEYWGLFTSNHCKNLSMERCSISRFDAHMGVENVSLKNCVFGHMGMRCVGFGRLLMENCEVHFRSFILLRDDYGSSWDGEVLLKNCIHKPFSGNPITLIDGANNGDHDFGYTCCLPSSIELHDVLIDDICCEAVEKVYLFGDFARDAHASGLVPYRVEGSILMDNVRASSGKTIELSRNPDLFTGYSISGR
ncbi:MAG: hypothetical protein IKR69_06550 [Bacteroidales bacterium]|nr:hypothetical protein [Bacteroidales bacterium]